MKVDRAWATPLTIGSFVLLSVTGILMFFHLDRGLNKLAHEWLSWALVAAVGLHVTSNLTAFKRHLMERRSQIVIGAAVLLLVLSFLPLGRAKGEPPILAPVRTLAGAPLPMLAQVAGVPTDEMRARLMAAGLTPSSDTDSVRSLVGSDIPRQIDVLAKVLPAAAPAKP